MQSRLFPECANERGSATHPTQIATEQERQKAATVVQAGRTSPSPVSVTGAGIRRNVRLRQGRRFGRAGRYTGVAVTETTRTPPLPSMNMPQKRHWVGPSSIQAEPIRTAATSTRASHVKKISSAGASRSRREGRACCIGTLLDAARSSGRRGFPRDPLPQRSRGKSASSRASVLWSQLSGPDPSWTSPPTKA